MLLKDKVVIITGAGRGIGKAAALKLAGEGAAVVVASRTPPELEKVAEEIKAGGGRVLAVPTDISVPEQVERMVSRAIDEFGRVDVMVNNAALPGPVKDVVDLDFAEWDFVYGINVRGTMACSKYALRHMIPQRTGSIINVSSTAGWTGIAGRTHYCSSKSAVIGFTRALAAEVGKYNVRVNCIVPGAVMTELMENYFNRLAGQQGVAYEEIKAQHSAQSPMDKMVEPDEVADLMIYLASDLSTGIHGQSININAGSWMN